MLERFRMIAALLALALAPLPVRAQLPAPLPPNLPSYDLDIHLDVDQHTVHVKERVRWTNPGPRPVSEVVFNVHAHYKLPDADVGMTAKMFEILRVQPGEALDLKGHAGEVRGVALVSLDDPPQAKAKLKAELQPVQAAEPAVEELPPPRSLTPRPKVTTGPLRFQYREDIETALVVALPAPVPGGGSVTLDLDYVLVLPQLEGRWGQWRGVTSLCNWLPVLAYYDDKGWQPTPFVLWHQPFFNEAGIYRARLLVRADQKVACTAPVHAEKDVGDGMRQVEFAPVPARDFALLCSAKFQEFCKQCGPVRVRCLANPEYKFYGDFTVQSACESLTAYTDWFGPYPYKEFTVVQANFGWYDNEAAGLLMLDERILRMSTMASGFVDFLVAHGVCHQWWYNAVGTNGYAETWMDEGPSTYFAYRLMRQKHGREDTLVHYPGPLSWLPNVRREDYRHFNLYGTIGRGEASATVQDLPKFEHIANVYAMCYERGSKILGILEDRLGEAQFLGFMHRVYRDYYFRMLRVADFQRELESYTGRSWKQFFDDWIYGAGMTDWCLESVHVQDPGEQGPVRFGCLRDLFHPCKAQPCKVTVMLQQRADYNETTTLGFSLDGSETYQVRVPIIPQAPLVELPEMGARIESLPKNRVRVEIVLPCAPTQVMVDPDQVLIDRNPANNCWKSRCRCRITPLYSFLDETDLTNAYDRWNFIAGPWLFAPTYDNPFFTRSTRFGVRAGAYRTASFEGGVYTAYRTDYRDFVTGVDMVLEHWPWNHTEIGFVAERRLANTLSGQDGANRGVLYGRYVIDYGDSLYLPPFQYVEAFGTIQDDLLPYARETVPGAERFKHQGMAGLHYHLYYLTPYWDPEGGLALDLSYATGVEAPGIPGGAEYSRQMLGQFTYVQCAPEGWGWWSESKLAVRAYGAFGFPSNIQYFALGGGELFRGFDLAQRQGNALWVGSAEWRFPLIQHANWGLCDRAMEIRNVNMALFTDVGDIYLNRHSLGGLAQAVGAGLRIDVAWFTFVERTILRFDAAQTINNSTPPQFWIGVEHPF